MKDLTSILDDILNNESLKNGKQEDQSLIHEPQTLYNGFPGEDDMFSQFGRSVKKQTSIKVESTDEFESELLTMLSEFRETMLNEKVLGRQIDKIREKLSNSKRELAIMLSDDETELNEHIKIKYELLTEEYERLREILPSDQPRKQKEIKVDLTQTQIVILFHHLKSTGMVGRNISNTILAANISGITGFSKEKIRQALSNINPGSESADADAFTEIDFIRVKRKIETLGVQIQGDLDMRF
jgi:hypothetical protein